jgi:hypothetical protein
MCTPEVDAKVLDGAAVIQMLSPKLIKTFQEDFLPYIQQKFETAKRVEIVWYVYKNNGLKGSTRERRSCGSSRMVLSSAQLPGKWKGLLPDNDNKTHMSLLPNTSLRNNSLPRLATIFSVVHAISKILCNPAHKKKIPV